MAYVIADKPAGFDPFAKQGKKEKTYYVSDTPVDFDPFSQSRTKTQEMTPQSTTGQGTIQNQPIEQQTQPTQELKPTEPRNAVDVPPPAVAQALSTQSSVSSSGDPVLSAVRNVLRPDYVQEQYLLATPYSQKPTSDVVSSANAITEKYKKQSNSAWKPGQYGEQIKRLYELDSKQFNTSMNATPAERDAAFDAQKKNKEEYNKLLATLPSSVQEQVAKDKAENRYYEIKKMWPGDLIKSARPGVRDELRELDEQLHLTDSTFENRVLSGRAKSWLDRVKFGQYAVHNAQQIATLFKEEPAMMQKAINRMRDMKVVAARDLPEGKNFVEKGFLGLLSNVAPMAETIAAGTVSFGTLDKVYWAMQGKGSVIYDYVTENNLDLTKMSKEELAKLDAVSSVAGAAYAAVEYIGNMYGLQKAGMSPKTAKQFVQKAMKDGAFWEKVTRGGARFFVEWMKEGGEEFLQPLITTTGQQVLEGNVDVLTNIEESLNEWWDALPAAAFMVAGGGGIAKLGDRVEQNKAQQATELAAADRSAREAMRPQNAQMTQTDRGIVPNRPEIVAQAQEEQAPEFVPQPRTAQITDIEKQINRELAIEERIENKTRKASVEESMVFDREELNARRERLDPNKRSNLNDIAQYISENSDMSFDEAFKDAAAWRVRKRQKFLEALRNDSLENIEVELGLKERTPIVYEQAQATEDSSVTQEKQTQPISEQAPANTTTTPVKANEKKTVEPVRSSTITLQNKAGKTRTVDVVKETDTAFLYRDEDGTQRRLMKTAWTKQTEQQFEPSPEQAINRQETIDQSAPKGKVLSIKEARADVNTLNADALARRAEELGITYNNGAINESELRKKVRQKEQGGFIDLKPADKIREAKHEFDRQSAANDNAVHEWYKNRVKSFLSRLSSDFVDRQSDIKKALESSGGEYAVHKLVLRSGSSAEAELQFNDASKKINKILPRAYRDTFKKYISAMRLVEATSVQAGKGVELASPIDAESAKNWINDVFNKMPSDKKDAVSYAAKTYWSVMSDQLKELYNEGLISKSAYDSIKEKHQFYSPRLFVDFIDPMTQYAQGKNTHDSGIKALGQGSESMALVQDPLYLMAHVITRAQSRIFNNRANKSLANLADDETNGLGLRTLKRKKAKSGKYIFESPKRGEGIVKFFQNGNEVRLAMPEMLAEEWNGVPPALSQRAAEFLQWTSGTKIVKAIATGANPEFAISNIPRDMAYAWFASGQYSSVLPVALYQIGSDYAQVIKDAITKKGAYREYIREGGGLNSITSQSLSTRSSVEASKQIHRIIKQISTILSWAGETSETATRLAVRNRGIKNGLDSETATFVARNMLDFSQGGTMAKAADNAIPYLNAAIQGTRGGFRAFKTNPAVASFKAAQLAALGYGMAYMVASLFPELWDSVSDREKATKWIIPLPFSKKDKAGNTKHAYIAIPKDQFQQFFAAVGQSLSDAISGRPWDKQLALSMKSVLPADVSTVPPVVAASLAYFGNYDTWTSEKVWNSYEDLSPNKEQKWDTSKIATDISDMAAMLGIQISPERLSAATSKIVPTSNPIGGLLSQAYGISKQDTENQIGNTVVEKIQNTPGLRRLLRFSQPENIQPYTQEKADSIDMDVSGMTDLRAREAIKSKSTEISNARQDLNLKLDKWMSTTDPTSSTVRKWISENIKDKEEQQRLWQRAKRKSPEKVKGLYESKPKLMEPFGTGRSSSREPTPFDTNRKSSREPTPFDNR